MFANPLPPDSVFIEFCDRDANWGPLLFLRPAPHQRISAWRTAFGAILLGVPFGLFATVLMTALGRFFSGPVPSLLDFPLILTVGYWVVGQITLARAWNRRSARLLRWS